MSACDHGSPPAPASNAAPTRAGALDAARLAQAASEPDQWFTTGRDASGSYYSPLADISADNVARLGFTWQYRLGTRRGLEATPVVIDGMLFASGNFGRVYAVDAATGKERWDDVLSRSDAESIHAYIVDEAWKAYKAQAAPATAAAH
jgi:quinohemoprotein ethanol dehydrogenase